MKIIHTSDLHLTGTDNERWEALLDLCNKVEELKADLFLISGDLFDRKGFSSRLRGEVRRVFRKLDAEVIIIPGNHDAGAFEAGLDYGAHIPVSPDKPVSIGDVDVWGMPYLSFNERETSEYIYSLAKRTKGDRLNLLLFHGELLDSFFSGGDYGGEEKNRYMPVRLSVFENCGFDYIVAGHFHTSYQAYKLTNGGYFVYPGSPVSITVKEVGQRYAGVIDTSSGEVYETPLNTLYYEKCVIRLDPSESTPPEKIVSEKLNKIPLRARIILVVTGFVNARAFGMTEEQVIRKIEEVSASRCHLQPEILLRDVGMIYENPLFSKICERVNGIIKNYDRDEIDSDRIKELLMRAFMEAEI